VRLAGGGGGHPFLHLLVVLVVVALFCFVLVLLYRFLAPRLSPAAATSSDAGSTDQALATLRLRYARGEVGRDEYLQASADLGASLPGV
jgi:uncharacterized membrane protein